MWIHPSKDITNYKLVYLVECPKKDNMVESHIDNNQGWNKIILKKFKTNPELTL